MRDWFNEHLISGTRRAHRDCGERAVRTLKAGGPPVPDDGLSIEALATGCVIRPVDGLPALRDADLNVHIVGRDAVVSVGKATADLPSGRKLVLSSGVFEVPDTAPHPPPARVRFKLDGPVPAAAELLRMDRLRDVADVPFDPSTIRGDDERAGHARHAAQVRSAAGLDHLRDHGRRHQFFRRPHDHGAEGRSGAVAGDRYAAGLPAQGRCQDRRHAGQSRIPQGARRCRTPKSASTGMLDEAARNNLGFDAGDAICGAIPIRLSGRVAMTSDREGRFTVDADLTPAQIDGLLPGWAKPSGKPARATFTLTTKPQSIRIEDLLIEGAGGGVKGTIELDGSGEVQSANFPAYGFSDGDRASLRIERAPDGALRVIMRGEVYDGRGFVKTAAGARVVERRMRKRQAVDVDLDMKLGAVVGFNGEALRSVDLKMSRRAGEIRSFGLNAKIGRDATLTGDLRGRTTDASWFIWKAATPEHSFASPTSTRA